MSEPVLRPATVEDSRRIWTWRNDPVTRGVSLTTAEVSWSDHERWYAATLTRDDRHLLVAEIDTEPVGVVRFDRIEHAAAQWEISVNLAPHTRGRGLGSRVVTAAHDWLDTHTDGGAVLATVRPDNAASLRVFARCGYTERERGDVVVTLVRVAT